MASVVIPGGGDYSEIQVTGVIEWGKISKPKKIPKASNKHSHPKKSHAEFPSLKNLQNVLNIKRAAKHWTAETSLVLYYSPNYAAGIRWPTTNPQIDLNLPKQNPYLNQANQNILPNFPTQKIPESNPKIPPWSVSGLLWRRSSRLETSSSRSSYKGKSS